MPDPCEQFVGRKKDICRGHDDAGIPVVLPQPHTRDAYLRRWGLLEEDNAESTAKVHEEKFVQTRINERASTTSPKQAKAPRPKDPPRTTLPPCVHLLDVIREEGCRLCGGRRVIAPIHGCGVHGECTQNNYGLKGAAKFLATCITCLDYAEIGGLETVPK